MNKIIFTAIAASLAVSTSNAQPQSVATSRKHLEHAKPWEIVKEKDLTEHTRSWSEIDCKARENNLFAYSRKSSRDVNLIDVLISGIESGRIKVYADDRFTKEMSKDELHLLLKSFSPATVTKYNLKEDRLAATTLTGPVMHIVSLGPVMGDSKEPLFWVYYPEARKALAESNVNCDDYDTPITWDDVMEHRLFSEHVTKSIDHPGQFTLEDGKKK
ncbi:MAG: hypothetical protein JSS82_12990 [Bacteroidetes bacterium]|nr:hypothetical protein [Bacteroidota bacterium]